MVVVRLSAGTSTIAQPPGFDKIAPPGRWSINQFSKFNFQKLFPVSKASKPINRWI
jgi:hypothetical protein